MARGVKAELLRLHDSLKELSLSNQALGNVPLARDLDPAKDVALPTRLGTLWNLIKDTIASAVRLPFFVLPLALHTPAYLAAKLTVRLVNPVEEESFAQNKIVIGLGLLVIIYPTLFFCVWVFLFMSPIGAMLAFGLCVVSLSFLPPVCTPGHPSLTSGFLGGARSVWAFALYHVSLVDDVCIACHVVHWILSI